MSALARKNEFNSCSLTVMFSLHRSNGPGKGGFPGLDRSWASKGQAEPGFTFSGLVGPSVPFLCLVGILGCQLFQIVATERRPIGPQQPALPQCPLPPIIEERLCE